MKKILYLIFFVLTVHGLHAQQPFMNEWIDYQKTYYKFKIGPFGYDGVTNNPIRKGVVRINQPELAAIGLQNTSGLQFQLWHDGEEIPLFVSANGLLSSNDYIEFWGEIASGKADKSLYRDSSMQLTEFSSLETDSASYFLTVNPLGNNKRFNLTANNSTSTLLTPERNFMYTARRVYRGYINNGFGVFVEQKLYSSSYETGEGYSSRPIYNSSPISWVFSNLNIDTVGAPMTLMANMVGVAPNERSIKISLNNDSLTQFNVPYFQVVKFTMSGIAANTIKDNNASFLIQNLTEDNGDECRIGKLELNYPRLFNFGGASSFEFDVDASAAGRYLKISNFDKGSAEAVLYDFTNGKKYIANSGAGDTLEFLLQPSTEQYHLLLIRDNGSTSKVVTGIQQRSFTDFSQLANQGNYLIITNPALYGNGANNYIQQYSDYRKSDTGGAFNVKIIDIHDLEDQFAWGVKMHPLAIKNFLRFSRQGSTPPSYVFLIGKGVTYTSYRQDETNPLTNQLNLVPVFGSPGSDNLLSSEDYDPVPATPIGRLSVVNADEVGVYLEKMKQYESAQRDTTSKTLGDNLWKKKVLQLAGANDATIENIIDSFQADYTKIISDVSFGASVKTYSKSTSTGNEYGKSVIEFSDEFNSGSALVEYLGHSSSTSIDFSLDNPANYTNTGRYPMFIVNGCLAGNIFDYDPSRLSMRSTISEKFVLEPQRGAIGYLSSSNYGVLDYLNIFTENFYKAISTTDYGDGFGKVVRDGLQQSLDYTGITDFYGRMHAEQLTFHGDPAVKLNYFPQADYAIDSSEISIIPFYRTVATDSFTVKVKIRNLGKAIPDSVHFSLVRKFPHGDRETIYAGSLKPLSSLDSLSFTLPIIGNRDKGTTIITASIDDNNSTDELKEDNNTASVSMSISAADLLPVSPYNYSIVTSDKVNLIASTAYVFDSLTQYVMELDTTSLYNSPIKLTVHQAGTGGIIEFPDVPLTLDNTVYFWRVSEDSADKHWNTFSFIRKSAGNPGFEQQHFFQHTESTLTNIQTDSTARSFNFAKTVNNMFIVHSIFPTSGNEDNHFSISLNGSFITWSACVGSSIIFNVFDPLTLKPILNTTQPYGAAPVCENMRRYNFEFSTQSPATRKNAMDFMDNYIANGFYVVVRKIYDLGNADWAPTVWAADTALYGSGNSLYNRLKDQGTAIDSFTYPRTFIFVYKKNDATAYKTISVLSTGIYDRISLSQNFVVDDTAGYITSPKFGPGKLWKKIKWSGNAENTNNNTSLDILAINKNGEDTLLYTIAPNQPEQDISSLDANVYPFVQLRMHTADTVTVRPYQLEDWTVEFTPVAEGAIANNLGSEIPELLTFDHDVNKQFDTLKGYIIFKNISNTAMTPIKVKLILYDENNIPTEFSVPNTRALPAGDTVYIPFLINVTALPEGSYNLYLDVNPDNDQPEQYHYNNFLYKYVDIKRDFLLSSHQFDLSASAINKSVALRWTVGNETNVSSYDVQFSTDAHNFKTIANVLATGITAPLKEYKFVHTTPVNGKNYYRIKMIDKDGTVKYSPVREVEMMLSDILVYPNPFHNQLNVILKETTGPVKVTVSDVSGRIILQQTFTGAATLNLNNIAAGMYILHVNDGTNVYSFKVYKQ